MRKLLWITVPASFLIAGTGYYLINSQPMIVSSAVNMAGGPRHPVSNEMKREADGKAGNPAPDFELSDPNGNMVKLQELLKKGPVVVVMTKDGCPCSEESQPFFNDLYDHYKDKMSFVAMIDVDRPKAMLYEGSMGVKYPIACETDGKTYAKYHVKQSVYTYYISQDGTLQKVWPGYWVGMLNELNQMIADETKIPAKTLSTKDAPEEPSSGCYLHK